jgi:hypothetical protein
VRAGGTGCGQVGTGANSRHGHVGLGMDSSCVRGCGRKHVGRERMGIGAGGWNQARMGGTGRGLEERTRGTRRKLPTCTGLRTRTQGPRADGRRIARSHYDGTRVWARTGATSGTGLNERVLERGQAHAAGKGAHAATGAGV